MTVRTQVPARILELAREVARIAREELGAETRVWLFGSWAGGQAVPRSDLDVAVEAEGPLDPRAWARVRERVEELPTLRSIDVVDLAGVAGAIRSTVLSTGLEL